MFSRPVGYVWLHAVVFGTHQVNLNENKPQRQRKKCIAQGL